MTLCVVASVRREWRERHVDERVMVDSRSVNDSIVGQHVSSTVVVAAAAVVVVVVGDCNIVTYYSLSEKEVCSR